MTDGRPTPPTLYVIPECPAFKDSASKRDLPLSSIPLISGILRSGTGSGTGSGTFVGNLTEAIVRFPPTTCGNDKETWIAGEQRWTSTPHNPPPTCHSRMLLSGIFVGNREVKKTHKALLWVHTLLNKEQ